LPAELLVCLCADFVKQGFGLQPLVNKGWTTVWADNIYFRFSQSPVYFYFPSEKLRE